MIYLLPIVFSILTLAGWLMWDAAGSFQDAFRALLAMVTGGVGMAGCAIWCIL